MIVKPAIDTPLLDSHESSKIVPFGKAKSVPENCSAYNPMQGSSKGKCFGTHSSVNTFGYETAQLTTHIHVFVDQALLSTNPTVNSGTSRLYHG
ncbi:uncharacterized protein TNCV_3331841 [Trichonephila clavipes]|nr:uncharacterized protein TNCV_3331841 [Trichonephila clavipes]